jgi:hypothetical protein
MIKNTKINNVKSYDVNSGFYIELSNKLICKNLSLQSNNNLIHVYTFGDIIMVLDDVNKAYILSDTSLIENTFSFRIGSLKFPFIEYYKKEQPRKYGIHNYLSQKNLFETTEWIGRDIFGEYIFCENQGVIIGRSVFTAEPLWQFDMGGLGEYETYKGEVKSYSVEKFIGVWEDELLVACSNSLILSFDVNTGVEKRRWQTLENYYPNVKEVANKIPRTENFVLETKTNTLIALHIFSLVKIELSTGVIQVVTMENELKKHNINLLKNNSSYAIDDNHIYTTSTMDYEDNKSQWTYDCLIAINRETYQVDWQYKFENEGLGTNTPQLSGDNLYQLTASNTLYIFEKENT